MAKQKRSSRHHDGSGPKGGVVLPNGDEIKKFGRRGEGPDRPEDGREIIKRVLGPGFDKVLDGYTDAQLKRMAREEGGIGGLFERLMEDSLFGDALPQLKQALKEHRRSSLSEEVEDYFDDVKARGYLRNGGAHFQMMADDRCGENMDIALALFELKTQIEAPGRENPAEKFERVLHTYSEGVPEFLVRVPSEYFKLLIYYCGLRGFEDIQKIMAHKGHVDFESLDNGRLRSIFQDPIELMCHIHERRLEELIKQIGISSMDDFHSLFFKTPDLILLVRESNWEALKKIMAIGNVDSVGGFQGLFADEKIMEGMAHIKARHPAGQNFNSVVDAFGINTLEALKSFLGSDFPFYQLNKIPNEFFIKYIEISEARNSEEFGKFLRAAGDEGRHAFLADNLLEVKNKFGFGNYEQVMGILKQSDIKNVLQRADPKNFRILLRVSPYKDLEDLYTALRNPQTVDALENAKYNALQKLFDSISSDEGKKSSCLYKLINGMDSEGFGYAEGMQATVKPLKEPPENLIDLLYAVLSKPAARYQNARTIHDLIKQRELTDSAGVGNILRLMEFSGGVLTEHLASQIIHANNPDPLLLEWKKEMKSFENGSFDPTNELHRNLEYLRFRRIIDSEKLKKHIKNSYTYEQYLRIFETPRQAQMELGARDQFEINCVAYEAKLLRDFVLDVARAAKSMGRKTLVVPNLSYGYLPVSPLIDEIAADGVEFAIGAKIGSTECHSNPDYVSSSLFKGHRTMIANEQPVIIVVDGTQHMVDERSGHKARYPDAYQGFLNQVIALNDSYGFEDADYGEFGKDERNMVSLRADFNFGKAVETYKKVRKEGTTPVEYGFGFWNSAGLKLAIRNYRHEVSESRPIEASEISGPIMIFANVGVLHEQIPEEIRNRHKEFTHAPAYFDDTGKIINFDFGFDNYGVKYLNRLETEVRVAYGVPAGSGNGSNEDLVSGLIKFVSKRLPFQPGTEEG